MKVAQVAEVAETWECGECSKRKPPSCEGWRLTEADIIFNTHAKRYANAVPKCAKVLKKCDKMVEKYHILRENAYFVSESANFFIARARCEMLFFNSMGSSAKVLS